MTVKINRKSQFDFFFAVAPTLKNLSGCGSDEFVNVHRDV